MNRYSDVEAVERLQSRFESQVAAQNLNHGGFVYIPFEMVMRGAARQDVEVIATASFSPKLSSGTAELVASGVTDVFTPYVSLDRPFLDDTAIRLWPLPLYDESLQSDEAVVAEISSSHILSGLWRCVASRTVPILHRESDLFRYCLAGQFEIWKQLVIIGRARSSVKEDEISVRMGMLDQLRLLYGPENQTYDLLRFSLNPNGWIRAHNRREDGKGDQWWSDISTAPATLAVTRLTTQLLREPEYTISRLKQDKSVIRQLKAILERIEAKQAAEFRRTLALYGNLDI